MMHFCIYTEIADNPKTLLRWTEKQMLEATEERLGKDKALVFKEIMHEFKKETIKIP